jgi:hypothetical protein
MPDSCIPRDSKEGNRGRRRGTQALVIPRLLVMARHTMGERLSRPLWGRGPIEEIGSSPCGERLRVDRIEML